MLLAGGVLAAVGLLLLWPARASTCWTADPPVRGRRSARPSSMPHSWCWPRALATVIALLIRLMRSRGVEHQQLKWLTYAGAFAVLGLLLLLPGDVWSGSRRFTGPGRSRSDGWRGPRIPVAVGVAILRYRLFDIDVLIARTVVYGLLSAAFTVIYLAMVVGIGTLIGSGGQPNLLLSVAATGVMAVAFQPMRDRSRRLANRLVYGNRATPRSLVDVLARHGERLRR